MRRNIKIGRLAIYSAGVFSDLLAELGAGALKLFPIAVRKVGFIVVTVLAVAEYRIAIVGLILLAIVGIAIWHPTKKGKKTRAPLTRPKRRIKGRAIIRRMP